MTQPDPFHDPKAVAAYADTIGPPDPIDTGSLRGDLEALVPDLHRYFSGEHGQILASLFTGAGAEPSVTKAIIGTSTQRRSAVKQVLERARARGEIAESRDLELIMDMMLGPLWTRLLVTGQQITPRFVRRLVRLTADVVEA